MIKVYFGSDSGLIAEKVREDTSAFKDVLIKYDASKDSPSDVAFECTSISFDGGTKKVLYSGVSYLSTSKVKGSKSQQNEFKELLSYIKNPDNSSDLYITVPGNLDSTNEIVKVLKDLPAIFEEVHELNDDDLYFKAARKAKKENKDISKEAVNLLKEYCRGDYMLFMNNLDKLLLYTDKIREDDVNLLVNKPLEDKVYDLAEKIVTKKKASALQSYQELRKNGRDAISILTILSNQFTFLALCSYLIKKGLTNEVIASELSTKTNKIKVGKIYFTRKALSSTSYSTLIETLVKLGQIEKDIKLNLDSADERLESFILTY